MILRIFTKFSAWFIYILILAIYGVSLYSLYFHREQESYWTLSQSLQIIKYSFFQAGISALLSTFFGLLLARAFFYLEFKFKAFLYKIISFVWSLPAVVVIFAIIGVWGNSGWISDLLHYFGLNWPFSIYGLQGIIIAHLFLNIPFVAKYCLEGLNLTNSNQHKLATQLNIKGWQYFKIIELPKLKGIIPYAFSHVFLLCFTSFPIVLMLGGSPKYSTLEVAIYQAVTFEFDFTRAIILIGIQLFIGVFLQLIMDIVTRYAFNKNTGVNSKHIWKPKQVGQSKRYLQIILFLHILFIIIPLINVVWDAFFVSNFLERLSNPALWESFCYSLFISLIASIFVIIIAYIIALETRQLTFRHKKLTQSILSGVTTYPLIFPVFLLAVGLFLFFIETELSKFELMIIVGLCNGFVLLPYIYRLLFSPMYQVLISYDKLSRTLGLKGLNRWWIVEKPYLIRPLINAFGLAMSASLGSFSIIAFFGTPDFSTLPYLLYQQLGSYHTEDAAITALILMLSALLPFLFIKQENNND